MPQIYLSGTFRSTLLQLTLIVFSFFLFTSCENDIKEVNEITKKKQTFPGEVAKNLDVIYTDSGLVTMHMTAPLMKHYNINITDPYEEFTEGIHVNFYNKKGEVKSTLKSNYAIRYDQTKKMEAKNKVVVVNEFGEQLNTEHLIWDENTRKIKTNGYVKITTKKETLEGQGLNANEDFSEWEILKITGHASIEN